MHMSTTNIIGLLLIVAGVLGLIYGGFSYTKETHSAKLGPLEFKVQEKETVVVPLVISTGAIALGVFLIVAGRNK
jgi:TRAP-type C4-dicarboxylate transport system permease small subunit